MRLPSTRMLRRLCAVLVVMVVAMWLAGVGIWLARGPYPIPGFREAMSSHERGLEPAGPARA